MPYTEARELVLDCYTTFSPELGTTAEEFFTGDYIDAPPGPGKRGGAFCSYAVPSAHPYVMLNYTSRPYDVLVMAHELGHGVHAALARPRGVFEFGTPLTVAETASIFGETIVLGRLLDQAPDDSERLALLGSSLDGAVGAVFRQVAMNRFEDRVHHERRETGELSVDDFAAAWTATQADLLGDSVEISEGYGSWWSYVPHFIATPGYVYAYSYGHLLALSVYSRYEEEGEGFVELLPRAAARRRLPLARGPGEDRRRRPHRSRLLERRPRPDRAPARSCGGGRGEGLGLIAAAAAVAAVAAAFAGTSQRAPDPTEVIGHSREGRPIVAREDGARRAGRTVLVVGSIHGNETEGRRIVGRLRHHSAAAAARGAVDDRDRQPRRRRGRDARQRARRRPQPQLRRRLEADPAVQRLLRGAAALLRARDQVRAPVPAEASTGRDDLVPPAVRAHADPVRPPGAPGRPSLRAALAPARARLLPTPPGAATGWQDQALNEKAFVVEFGAGPITGRRCDATLPPCSRSPSRAAASAWASRPARGTRAGG